MGMGSAMVEGKSTHPLPLTGSWWSRISYIHTYIHNTKDCKIVDICVPLDTNVELRHTTKIDDYIPLVDQLQRIYPAYKYTVIPVIVGTLGTIPKTLKDSLLKIGLQKVKLPAVIEAGADWHNEDSEKL